MVHGALLVVVELPEPELGQTVLVAVLYGPVAEVAEQTAGTLLAELSPQEAGTTDCLRAEAVRREAYDQVRAEAESGVPSVRENCSVREPSEGVYVS